MRFSEIIYSNNYYWTGIYEDSKLYVQNCDICVESGKTILKKPDIKYLQANKQNEIIHMDITDLPSEFNIDNIFNKEHINSKLACIVDNLSKFAYAEIIPNKKALNILPVLMRYINLKGKPDFLLTDNGTEFCNHIFSDYLDNLKIEKRNTRPYNPACNGIVERFNHTIKDLLKKEYLKNKQAFNLRLTLENCLYYYNNRKHNSTQFSPNYLFNSKLKWIGI